jgi:superfamily II RNA helicase
MPDFWQTRAGMKFTEGTMPRIASALEDIVKELKRANNLKEKELKCQAETKGEPESAE